MCVPAGVEPPAPVSLDDVAIVHAVDGDGTALCSEALSVEQVNGCLWPDVPDVQRCSVCQMVMSSVRSTRYPPY
jgi:hypothetical protein